MPADSMGQGAGRRVLLIDDDPPLLQGGLPGIEADLHLACSRSTWLTFTPDMLGRAAPDLLIPVVTGAARGPLALFRWIEERCLAIPTLAVLAHETQREVVEKTLAAADDFLVWPTRPDEWRYRVTRMVRPLSPDPAGVRDRLTGELGLAQLVGEDPAFLATMQRIPLAARCGSPVLITGETGTGKELCARAIHHLGARRNAPFIPVDCGALPDHLFENEFFGHARGAFTDASGDQRGLVALAQGGTLFLDEVDSLSVPAQAKLLRFLQERTYKPLGSERFKQADVGLIAATNGDLDELVQAKRFRRDLYFRLNVVRLHMAPLRDRPADVGVLARHFLATHAAQTRSGRKALSVAALRQLARHDWPGNVRELFNVVQRAALFTEGPIIQVVDLPGTAHAADADGPERFGQARTRAIERFERVYVEDLLRRNHGNVSRAAREAGKERRAFGRLIKKYSIPRNL